MSGFSYSQRSAPFSPHGESAFGESLTTQASPTAQATFVHGINDILIATSSNGIGASVSAVSGTLVIHSGQSTSGSSVCTLRRPLKYRAGEGSLCRMTSIFGPPENGTVQLVGAGNSVSGHYFAYSGSNFGILHETGGVRELRKLLVTSGVASTTNVTVTLDDDVIVVPIAGASSIDQTVAQIAIKDYSQVGDGWIAEAHSASVYFIANRVGAKGGTYSATGAGLSATFSQISSGQNIQRTFISQSQWNVDRCDGTGVSGFTLHPNLGNVYQVQFQYLGYGNARFSVENSATGHPTLCHMIRHVNTRTTPVLSDPQIHASWKILNEISAVGTHMSGASAATFNEGPINRNIGIAFSASGNKTGVTTGVPIISIRSNEVSFNKGIYGEIDLSSISASAIIGGAATRASRIFIYKNLNLTGPTLWLPNDANRSIASIDKASTGYSIGSGYLLTSFLVTTGQTVIRKLVDENYFITSGETITVVAEATDSSAIDISISWFEDQ